MKRLTTASLKRVTQENLVALGVDRLAEILVAAADARPELKRRLRMELAAAQGADHLALEIDKRLASLETSRGKIACRQRPAFVKDLDGLRLLIAGRLAELDAAMARARLWTFMGVARRVGGRVRDRDGSLAAVFDEAAQDLGRLLADAEIGRGSQDLVDAIVEAPGAWSDWLPALLAHASPDFAADTLRRLSERPGAGARWLPLIRQLADAADDPGAYRMTFTQKELLDPSNAAAVATRLLKVGRVSEAKALLEAPKPPEAGGGRWSVGRARPVEPDFDWETAWIEVLDRSGQGHAAQAARWASFERTLAASRARDFAGRLVDFDDVEAESRAFAYASGHADVERALQFLIDWPALDEVARLIEARADDLQVSAETAERWAAKLRVRRPAAAELLLRKAAAAAFRRRDLATCTRLSAEADAIGSA